jgi:1,4-alpha-glucan branching enzyme
MLMEAEQPNLMKKAFDMQYGWEVHHVFNGIAKGEKTVSDFDKYIKKVDSLYEKNDIHMNFTSNHDENSWNGTEYERMGDAVETFAALSYTIPGMPLIYNGQEYDLKKRLRFFEKDTIPHTTEKMMTIYEKLGKLKTENAALHGGKNKASYQRLTTSDNAKILAFERAKDGKKVIYVSNLTKSPQTFTTAIEGNFTDYMSGAKINFTKDQKTTFKPWEYKILVAE